MLVHNHLLVKAEVNSPIKEEQIVNKWLTDLVEIINMKIIMGPYTSYISTKGNVGITGIVAIETSHIAIHIWDEMKPALVQFDVYSCANFSTQDVLDHTLLMDPVKVEYLLVDRSDSFKQVISVNGSMSDSKSEGTGSNPV